jgi:hypothetical protein
MIGRLLWIVRLSILGALPLPAASQTPSTIDYGQRITASTLTDGGEFYAFVGLKDTKVRVQLALPGSLAAVTFYDQTGGEIARADGVGDVSLEHALGSDGIYLLGVTSASKGQQFALTLDGTEPEYDPVPAPTPAAASEPMGPTASATRPPETPLFAADPAVWGVYARLAGRRTVNAAGNYMLAWVWSKPGEELVEQWLDDSGRIAHTNTLTPTGKPSQLLQRGSYLGGKEWLGMVGADGRVTFVGRGLIKKPYVVDVSPDGQFRMLKAKVDADGRPAWIGDPYSHAVWQLAPSSSEGF